VCVVGVSGETSNSSQNHIISHGVVFFDCEATGLDAKSCEIIEIGIISGHGELLLSQRAKPSRPIPPRVTELTGISDNDLTHERPESLLVATIHPILAASDALGGYFLHLDLEYLRLAYERAGMSAEFYHIANKPQICAKTLARLITPEVGLDFSLPDLCTHLGVTTLSNHRAIDDARMSLLATRALCDRSSAKTLSDLLSLQGTIVESPWEIPHSTLEQVSAARLRWKEFVTSTVKA
jgi:DNA polymerase-3 subunit alpha (Gram-positive type)